MHRCGIGLYIATHWLLWFVAERGLWSGIEAMAAGGLPLLADSRGLRACGEGAFPADQPRVLRFVGASADPSYRSWIQSCLALRVRRRLLVFILI